jgi:hypothetical protein
VYLQKTRKALTIEEGRILSDTVKNSGEFKMGSQQRSV